jgi:hypothetical protein
VGFCPPWFRRRGTRGTQKIELMDSSMDKSHFAEAGSLMWPDRGVHRAHIEGLLGKEVMLAVCWFILLGGAV